MHQLALTFLALYLAHLLTDFVFQSSQLAARKRQRSASAYAHHGAVHLAAALLLLAFANVTALQRWCVYIVLIGLVLVHLLVDHAKLALVSSGAVKDGLPAFGIDQLVHAATVLVASLAITRMSSGEFLRAMGNLRFDREAILWVLVIYVGAIWGGGYLLRYVTRPLVKRGLPEIQEGIDEIENAGLYIGWLERFLVLTALLLRSPVVVGLILTAKSVARYPELKSFRFAEYFLIGTLLSISLGIVGGILLLHVLHLPAASLAP